jgi:hypothetical protein
MADLHAGFQRPDADARQDGLFAFLAQVDGLPQVQAIKRRMADLLGPSAGQHPLEIGCGMGHELRRLAGPGRRGRGGDTRGARLPILAGSPGRRTRRISQRHVRRVGRLGPRAWAALTVGTRLAIMATPLPCGLG